MIAAVLLVLLMLTVPASAQMSSSTPKIRGSTSLPTMVLATDSNTTLLAANTARTLWGVCNFSSSPMLVKFGSNASTSSFNVRIKPGACYETGAYTGQVDAIWYIGADGYAMVSEAS